MKSFLFITTLTIAISIACTNRSVGSQSSPTNSTAIQSPTSVNGTTQTQEKVPCTLTLVGAPSISGLRLGLTVDEVLALFPGSKEDPDVKTYLSRPPSQLGVSSLLIRPAKYGSKDQFAGTSQINFTFLDGRISNFSVGYNGPEYSHVDKFVAKFLEGTNLPAVDQWEPYVGMDNTLKVLKCSEFEVNVFIGGAGGNLNYVLVKDLVADKKLKDRRAKARAQASPTP